MFLQSLHVRKNCSLFLLWMSTVCHFCISPCPIQFLEVEEFLKQKSHQIYSTVDLCHVPICVTFISLE